MMRSDTLTILNHETEATEGLLFPPAPHTSCFFLCNFPHKQTLITSLIQSLSIRNSWCSYRAYKAHAHGGAKWEEYFDQIHFLDYNNKFLYALNVTG